MEYWLDLWLKCEIKGSKNNDRFNKLLDFEPTFTTHTV